MQKKMQKPLLLLFVLLFVIFSAGCSPDSSEVIAGIRMDKFWEADWGIEERNMHIAIDGEKVSLEAHSVIQYLGEEPAQDVRIIIRSPLTCKLIDDRFAIDYGNVERGEKLEYSLSTEHSNWPEGVSVGIFEDKLKNDFLINNYVDISWKYEDKEYNVQFFDWDHGEHH